jgi:hypothetical protein
MTTTTIMITPMTTITTMTTIMGITMATRGGRRRGSVAAC